MSDLLFGVRWQTAAWRAAAVFMLLYVLPAALLPAPSRLAAFLQLLGTVLSFVLTAAAAYLFLQIRAGQEWELTDEAIIVIPTAVTREEEHTAPAGVVAETAAQVTPRIALDTLGQAALERLCIALYRFNGLHSQTIATGVDGAYRIRLVPRNADKAFAILQCHAGEDAQGVEAYTVLLRVMEEDGLSKAFFVAPAGFTAAVSADARSRHVTLVDLKLLQAMLDHLPEAARMTVLEATG
ncbi:MAG: endonuclease [Rhodocyclales bacterium]|nr:endonuclease [Rhodocyclales bacterium]